MYEAEAVLEAIDDFAAAIVEDAVACLGVQGAAAAAGVTPAAVQKWLRGARPRREALARLLAAMDAGGCGRPRVAAVARRLHRRTAELLAALEAAARGRG